MPEQPSISVRKYIKWGNNAPSEPTTTLVLTSPAKNFVDVRILRSDQTEDLLLPNDTPITNPARLEWAFAGVSSSTEGERDKPAHTVWKHWVDSKTAEAEQVADAGDMHVQPNGEVLEQGSMINPSTNKVEQYEECWVDLKDEDGREKVGWVLKVEEEGMKGMMVRVGGWIQGVLRRGEEFEVARWRFTERKGWEQLVGIGRLELPREVFWHEGVRDGVKFMGNQGEEWVCVESFTWT